jgi:Zinc finger, C3HC4 type (RING finger)/AP2 domain
MFCFAFLALAYDFYGRKLKLNVINFPNEQLTEAEIEKRKLKQYDFSARGPARGHGKSKYRGVHWQKNRKRWMARYTLSQKGEKNINLGAFETAEYAAMAFDFEARKRGRPECDLNFPENHPTEEQIEQWKTNTAHYTMMRSGKERSSQYRGVTWHKGMNMWLAQCNILKVVKGMGKEKGPVPVGRSRHEAEAALAFDRACRKCGVPEKELNFPRNHQLLNEVRLFDDECYFCFQKSPTDPVATPCNHVFCRACISSRLEQSPNGSCPCCNMPDLTKDALRSVMLVPWAVQPVQNKPRKRKQDDEENQSHIAAAAAAATNTANSNPSDSGMDNDDYDGQGGPLSDSDHDESDMRKAGYKRMKSGSKFKHDTHDENSSDDDDDDDVSEHDSQQKKKKRRRSTSSSTQRSTRHPSSLAKILGCPARRQPMKYPVGTRFIKVCMYVCMYVGQYVSSCWWWA